MTLPSHHEIRKIWKKVLKGRSGGKDEMRERNERIIEAGEQPEIWKKILGYNGGYAVSNWGRVARIEGKFRKPLQQYISGGYFKVTLVSPDKLYEIFVHRLVYSVFIGRIPVGWVIHHIDHVKRNNHLWNLKGMRREDHEYHHTLVQEDRSEWEEDEWWEWRGEMSYEEWAEENIY